MIISVSLMLLNEGMLQETKIISLPIYNTEFRIYNNTSGLVHLLRKRTPQLRISLRACTQLDI